MSSNQNVIGYAWLAERFGVDTVQPIPVRSVIAPTRTVRQIGSVEERSYPPAMRPPANLAAHLTFALKHEGVDLEFLARLFHVVDARDLASWVRDEPTGQYARRVGFLYEWLTGRQIDFPGVAQGNYVDALSAEEMLVSLVPVNVARWRVRDNLPGTRDFCPTVRWTPRTRQAAAFDCAARMREMQAEFGEDTLRRSAVWLTLKESRSSFAIERESDQTDRIRRFAHVMEVRCGQAGDPLSEVALSSLQAAILGPRSITLPGLRKGPVFVGESGRHGEIVHYVAPHWDRLRPMLAGLSAFAEATRGTASVVRAAVLSFGFVFIHPMPDGNGRISRFLINDTLRRDGALPDPVILPVSVKLLQTNMHPLNYDQALERYSKPLMARYSDAWRFGSTVNIPGGGAYNFHFSAYDDAQFAWAYPDLTDQVEYMGQVVAETIDEEMQAEAAYLHEWRRVRDALKSVIEGPDADLDRIIRSVATHGSISGRLRSEFQQLEDPALASEIQTIVQQSALRVAVATAPAPPGGSRQR